MKLRSRGDTVRVREKEGYTWCKYSAYVWNSQKLKYRVKLKEMEKIELSRYQWIDAY